MLARICFLILYLFVLVNSAHGSGHERIQNYHVDIKVLETGNLEITEKIKVFATGQEIQRGIYRWFPLSNVESFQKKNPYFDLTVKRDGRTENIAKIEKSISDFEVTAITYYFGYENIYLDTPSSYVYEISYKVDKAIMQYDETDQLYWNVIPTNWSFKIDQASASISFPLEAKINGLGIFSGKQGAEKNNSGVESVINGQTIDFKVVDGFRQNQGFSVKINLSPDFLQGSDNYPILNDTYFLRKEEVKVELDIINLIFCIIFLLLTALPVIHWYMKGRDDQNVPTIIPQFYPPSDISPAAARYIIRKGLVDKTKILTIALISLASKSILELSETNILRIRDDDKIASLGEKALLKQLNLNKKGDDLKILQSENFKNKMKRAATKLVSVLGKEHQNSFKSIKPNLLILFIVPLVATIILLFLLKSNVEYEQFVSQKEFPINLFLSLVSAFLGFSLSIPIVIPLFGLSLFGFFVNAGIFDSASVTDGILVSIIGVTSYLTGFFVKASDNFTKSGGKVIAFLEGLKMYIKAAELQSLKDEPKPSSKQFSDVYPYAFMFGLETEWADKFQKLMPTWDENNDYNSRWYRDRNPSPRDDFFSKTFQKQFSKAANYRPPSTSGTSGSSFSSGSSGGGGGGGGGGGW